MPERVYIILRNKQLAENLFYLNKERAENAMGHYAHETGSFEVMELYLSAGNRPN